MKERKYDLKRTEGESYLNITGTDPRVVILRASTFVDIQKSCERDFGDESSVIFYEAGIDVGKTASDILTPNRRDVEECFRDVIGEYYNSKGVGWFKLERISFDQSTLEGKIVISQSFIAREYRSSKTPVCHFLCGFFAGVIEALLGEQLICEEVACEAQGNGFCEFRIYQPQ